MREIVSRNHIEIHKKVYFIVEINLKSQIKKYIFVVETFLKFDQSIKYRIIERISL